MNENESKTRKWYRQNPRQTACKQYLFSIEADVYENFREYAFQNGHSINSMVGELIKKALRNETRGRNKTTKRKSLAHTRNRESGTAIGNQLE